jgi:hypothetical protein
MEICVFQRLLGILLLLVGFICDSGSTVNHVIILTSIIIARFIRIKSDSLLISICPGYDSLFIKNGHEQQQPFYDPGYKNEVG